MRTSSVLLLALSLLLGGAVAAAQDKPAAQTESTEAKARELFEEAMQAMGVGNAALGRDLLRRSLALDARIPTRYNLGIALRKTGQTTEAIDTFEGLLNERVLSHAHRAEIEEQLKGAKAELAILTVDLAGADGASIELDGQPVGEATGETPLRLVIDPGPHIVTARAGGTSQQKIDAGPGETVAVTLHVLSITERDRANKEKRRRKRAGWISGGVAVVAAIVVTAVVVSQNQTPGVAPARPGDGSIEALRRRDP